MTDSERIIAELIPGDSFLTSDRVEPRSWRKRWGWTWMPHDAAIRRAAEFDARPEDEYHSARSMFSHPSEGTIIDILIRRIVELEDENAIMRGILGSVPPPPEDEA